MYLIPQRGQPTTYPPRSPGKIVTLAVRLARREKLFHPGDVPLPENVGLKRGKTDNGHSFIAALIDTVTRRVIEDAPAPEGGRMRSLAEIDRASKDYVLEYEAYRKRQARRKRKRGDLVANCQAAMARLQGA